MFLYVILFITFVANIWLGWMISSWAGVTVFLAFIPVSILLTIGGGLALGLVGMVFGKHDDRTRGQRFLRNFLRGWAWIVCAAWMLPWIFFGALHFSNDALPGTLPKITLSNGEKTVVFQSMMHIGSPGFYADIKKDMEGLRGQDYVFFYEGVRPGTPENMEKLSTLIGTDISEKMYSIFAEMGGLVMQDGDAFLGIIPSTNIDFSADDIVAFAEAEKMVVSRDVQPDVFQAIREKYPSFNPFQKYIAREVSRGLLNILLRSYTNPALPEKLKNTMPVFNIILDKRNTLLSDAILTSPVPHIYIHYGALHYPGVLALLKAKDPRWQEIARTEFQVIR